MTSEKFQIHPITHSAPRLLTDVPFWHYHIPFAFALVEALRPRLFVELGTQKGDSYCAFCQAVDELGLDTACYAVDSWRGDVHVGNYDETVLEQLRIHHDPLYGGFSHLVQSTFAEAAPRFLDGSIDLLHIDGTHTYEAVKQDFQTWLPKMSERGVVLLHDTNVRKDNFSVWRLWQELRDSYPGQEFKFGHGLGLLSVGRRQQANVQALFDLDQGEWASLESTFCALGNRIHLLDERSRLSGAVAERDRLIAGMKEELALLRAVFTQREHDYAARDAVAKERDEAFEDLHRNVADGETAIANLKERVRARDGEVAALGDRAGQREEELKALHGALATRGAELAEASLRASRAEAHLARVFASRLWRLTGPIRRIHRSLLLVDETADPSAELGAAVYNIDSFTVSKERAYGWGFMIPGRSTVAGMEFVAGSGKAEQRVECIFGLDRADVAFHHAGLAGAAKSGFLIMAVFKGGPVPPYRLAVRLADGGTTTIPLASQGGGTRGAKMRKRLRMGLQLGRSVVRHLQRRDFRRLIRRSRDVVGALRTVARSPRIVFEQRSVEILRCAASRVLIFDHAMGGGANYYRERVVADYLAAESAVLVVTYDLPRLAFRIAVQYGDKRIEEVVDDLACLVTIAIEQPFGRILVNNLVSYEAPLEQLRMVQRLKSLARSRLAVACHDYFALCPSWHLIDDKGGHCDVPDLDRCRVCMSRQQGAFTRLVSERDVSAWRQEWGLLLAQCDEILLFSESSCRLLLRAYPDLDKTKLTVRAHVVDKPACIPSVPLSPRLRIGVVGSITYEKGADIVVKMAKLIRERGLNASIVVIGTLHPSANIAGEFSAGGPIEVTGTYKREDLPFLIQSSTVQVCFVPSICSESFCYVAEELMQMGLPVVAFDLGAQAERVKRYPRGLIVSEISADAALDALIALHSRHFAAG